jgi:hypothetical protein
MRSWKSGNMYPLHRVGLGSHLRDRGDDGVSRLAGPEGILERFHVIEIVMADERPGGTAPFRARSKACACRVYGGASHPGHARSLSHVPGTRTRI